MTPSTRRAAIVTLAACFAAYFSSPSAVAQNNLGLFDSQNDVGETPKHGSATFEPSLHQFQVTGGGDNIWKDKDAFHYVWKKMSGDLALEAEVRFEGSGAVAHRKAALMIRQNLDAGSAYADAALHGDGLTSLQYRPSSGAQTEEARSELKAPTRIRIERRGNEFTLSAGAEGEPLKPVGPVTVVLQDPVYVGLAVCSHDAQVLETAVFSKVHVESLPARQP